MDMETIYTPSVSADERSINDQSTDNFDLILEDSEYVDENNDSLDAASDHSTSVSPSIYDHEFGHGRRYHSYKSGRYPMPNDSLQIELEELKNRISTDLMVRAVDAELAI